ncbi:LamG-like jellyroll fold domain-containing protein, partial [Planctomycetota bacterium]
MRKKKIFLITFVLLLILVPNASGMPPDLLAGYDFDNLKDVSGNGYDGVENGTVTLENGYLVMDGISGNFVEIPFGADNPITGSQPYTIAMSVITETEGLLWATSIEGADPAGSTGECISETDGGYELRGSVSWVQDDWASGVVDILDGQEHDIALTYDGDGTFKFYFDGEQAGEDIEVGQYTAEDGIENYMFTIGDDLSNWFIYWGNGAFNGQIGYFYVFSRELSAEEMAVFPLPAGVRVSNEQPSDKQEHVRFDVEQVCFYPPTNAQVWDPCEDPNLLQGPFDFYVYFKPDDPCNMPLIDTILNHDSNDQICVNVGPTLPGVTYYWRVDINDQNEPGDPVLYEGPVFSFTKWGYAVNPIPEDEATDVSLTVDPNWQNDGYAAEFDAFFGSDEADVDASEQGALVGDTQGFYDIPAGNEDQGIEPGELLFGKTYYWRVDECNIPHGCVHGDVWSFSTALCDPIDDFEDYTKSGGDNWI